MKKISLSRICASFGMLISLSVSCSKDAPIVPAPPSATVQTGPRTIPTCDSCGGTNNQSTNSPRISMEVTPSDWIDKGNNLFVFELKPHIGKLPYDLWEYYPTKVEIGPGSQNKLVINQGNTITYRWGNLKFLSYELELQTPDGALPPTFSLELDMELL